MGEKSTKNQENLSKMTVKNSAYTLASIFISKIGGLIFTILIARLLLPELFGIYNLAFSVVIIAIALTNLGFDTTVVRYVSDALGKNQKSKARSYFKYLLKIKSILIIVVILIFLLISKYLAYNVFNKPILFYPLLFSCLYLLIESLRGFISSLFLAIKNLRVTPILEIILQVSKILFSLLAVLFLSSEFKISGIFVALAISAFLSLLFSLVVLIKKEKYLFFGKKVVTEKSNLLKYLKYIGLTTLSLVFFGSIDTLMLGAFVDASYIGYYRAALGLVITLVSLLSISGILLPIFTQIHKKRLERGFKKTFKYTIMLAIPATLGIIFVAKYLIFTVYGSEYMLAVPSLYVLSVLVLIGPLITFYTTLFSAKEKAKFLAKSLFIALVINIILNYVLIKALLTISQDYAIIGAGIATVVSRIFLLITLSVKTKFQLKLKVDKIHIIKPLIASLIMVLFLLLFNYLFNINWIMGIVEIILAVLIYFSILWLIKGIGKEDFDLIRYLKPKNF